MTREEASIIIGNIPINSDTMDDCYSITEYQEAKAMAIAALKAEPCKAVSRQKVAEVLLKYAHSTEGKVFAEFLISQINALPPVTPKQRLCKDCKWWKDSDGVYRRDTKAESRCPVNLKEVFEGNGYCFLFEPKEGESE